MKFFAFLILSFCIFVNGLAATNGVEKYNRLRGSSLKNAMDGGVSMLIIDLRDQKSFFKGRVRGAVNITPKEITERAARRFAPKKDQYIVIYSYDRESTEALQTLQKMEEFGYTNIYLFENGYEEWDDRDYPVEKGAISSKGKKLS